MEAQPRRLATIHGIEVRHLVGWEALAVDTGLRRVKWKVSRVDQEQHRFNAADVKFADWPRVAVGHQVGGDRRRAELAACSWSSSSSAAGSPGRRRSPSRPASPRSLGEPFAGVELVEVLSTWALVRELGGGRASTCLVESATGERVAGIELVEVAYDVGMMRARRL
jgi:hypothetical protein